MGGSVRVSIVAQGRHNGFEREGFHRGAKNGSVKVLADLATHAVPRKAGAS